MQCKCSLSRSVLLCLFRHFVYLLFIYPFVSLLFTFLSLILCLYFFVPFISLSVYSLPCLSRISFFRTPRTQIRPSLIRKERQNIQNPQNGSFVEQTNIIGSKQHFMPCEENKRATSYQSTVCSARSSLNTLHFWSSTELKYLIYYVSP